MIKKIFAITFSIFLLLIVTSVCFIKFNTSVAANFTDDVLRPIFGANNVIFLEKIFFNASDKMQQITNKSNSVQAPQFDDSSQGNNLDTTGLSLNIIPTNKNLNKLENEGVWKVMKLNSFPNAGVMAYTFVRPDLARPYSVVTIAQLNMTKMKLGIVAGTKEPGGKAGNPGPGVIPKDIVDSNNLIAAFDGGFQYRDGEYGMIADGKTYLPLKNDLGTIVGYKNGTIKIVDYTGQDLGKDVAFIRQNCPVLIENGQSGVEDIKNKKLWGRTLTSSIYTWRTGLGINKDGNLLFAVGNNLTPATLAKALQMVGAQDAIQLDINPNWVRFNVFNSLGNGKYISKPLTKDLKNGAVSYLTGYSKDFFYVYKK
jgi:hypothetical protein